MYYTILIYNYNIYICNIELFHQFDSVTISIRSKKNSVLTVSILFNLVFRFFFLTLMITVQVGTSNSSTVKTETKATQIKFLKPQTEPKPKEATETEPTISITQVTVQQRPPISPTFRASRSSCRHYLFKPCVMRKIKKRVTMHYSLFQEISSHIKTR